MADAARLFGDEAEQRANELMTSAGLQAFVDGKQPFVLATLHRAENTDDPDRLEAILKALATMATNGADGHNPIPVLLPLHPRTKARISTYELQHLLEPLTLIPPIGFMAMVLLERRASLVVTDSGGVQKEAFLHGTPCVTVRTETEWVELIECGWNRLADPSDTVGILKAMNEQLAVDINRSRPPLYGDGHAADEMLASLNQMVEPL